MLAWLRRWLAPAPGDRKAGGSGPEPDSPRRAACGLFGIDGLASAVADGLAWCEPQMHAPPRGRGPFLLRRTPSVRTGELGR